LWVDDVYFVLSNRGKNWVFVDEAQDFYNEDTGSFTLHRRNVNFEEEI
tara:strand:+ start:826 stop:969 length:144 start_codon:yes stop_codon:yes gene_type:complete